LPLARCAGEAPAEYAEFALPLARGGDPAEFAARAESAIRIPQSAIRISQSKFLHRRSFRERRFFFARPAKRPEKPSFSEGKFQKKQAEKYPFQVIVCQYRPVLVFCKLLKISFLCFFDSVFG
jgi:hypothetical protein